VANADRRLPVLDAAADVVISIHARRNPKEAGRILKSTGFLLVAVPAADDLLELRAAVQGDGTEQDRSAMLIAEHADGFDVVDRWTLRQQEELDRDALIALLRGTYRGERFSESERVQELATMHVTLASDVVVFAPRR
jgi:hypothetical protein